jgi:hypothetical protein
MRTTDKKVQNPRPGHLLLSGSSLLTGMGSSFAMVIFLLFLNPSTAGSQTMVSLVATSGSLAPWGWNQGLVILSSGNTRVYQSEFNSGTADSAVLTMSQSKMQAIVDTAIAVGFFGLDTLYDSHALDGSGIWIRLVTSTDSNHVETRNFCLSPVNRLVKTINLWILPGGIQLGYNYLDVNCP